MPKETKHFPLESKLIFWESSELPIKIRPVSISLTKQNSKIKGCNLTFKVSPELYQRIDKCLGLKKTLGLMPLKTIRGNES